MKINAQTCAASLAVALLISGNAFAENWASWRGPTSNGICNETDLPISWSKTENVAWRLPLPGPGGATPVIWGDKIFLTSVDGNELVLICISTAGKELWKEKVTVGNKDVRGDEGNFASPSAVTDGEHVWSFMGNGVVGCYDMNGKEVWKLDLQERYGKFSIAFGLSSTPVLHKDRICFQLIHGEGKAATQEAVVVALDKATGDEIWKQDRVTKASNENEHAYSSPMLYDFGGTAFLITHGADFTIAYDLEGGKELWRLGGLNPQDDPKRKYHPTLRFVASAAAAEGIVVSPTAKNGPVFAIRPEQQGDLTNSEQAILWKRDNNTPDVPSPLIHDGLVYLCREGGQLLVLDQKTGEEIYHERTNDQRHRASPVYADGKIYLTARDGKVTVVKAGREFEVLSTNDLDEAISSSPAISNGVIYLRTFDALYAIKKQ